MAAVTDPELLALEGKQSIAPRNVHHAWVRSRRTFISVSTVRPTRRLRVANDHPYRAWLNLSHILALYIQLD